MFKIKLDLIERELEVTELSNIEVVAVLAVVFNIKPYEIEVYEFYGRNIVYRYDLSDIDVIEYVKKSVTLDPSEVIYRSSNMLDIFQYQLEIVRKIEKGFKEFEKKGRLSNAAL